MHDYWGLILLQRHTIYAYPLFICLHVWFSVLSDNTTTYSWLPKYRQKNRSNDLALFFSLLGA